MRDLIDKADHILRNSHRFNVGDKVKFRISDEAGARIVRGKVRRVEINYLWSGVYEIELDNPWDKIYKDEAPRNTMMIREDVLTLDTLDYMRKNKK